MIHLDRAYHERQVKNSVQLKTVSACEREVSRRFRKRKNFVKRFSKVLFFFLDFFFSKEF